MAAGPEILIPILAISFGIPFVVAPLVKALSKRLESGGRQPDAELMARLSSIERNVDVIAIEIGALPPAAP